MVGVRELEPKEEDLHAYPYPFKVNCRYKGKRDRCEGSFYPNKNSAQIICRSCNKPVRIRGIGVEKAL